METKRVVYHSDQDCMGRRSASLDVPSDSLCLHPSCKSSSPFIVISDQSCYTTIFVQAQCKTMYFLDPMAHPALDDMLSAFKSYHDTRDVSGLLAVPGGRMQVAV